MKKSLSIIVSALAICAGASVVVPFSPKTGEEFTSSVGGKLVRVEAFAPTNGTVVLKSIYSADVTTNAVETSFWTNFNWTVVTSNAVTHALATNVFENMSWRLRDDVIGVTTNVFPHSTSRSWPVYKETVAVTNDIVSGSASANIYTNDLATPVYLAPGERLLYTGTGAGGWIRLIFD